MSKKPQTRISAHPGEILSEEFMKPLALSARALSDALDVPPNRITTIVNGTRSITADTAHRLAIYFSTTPAFWMNLQTQHDLSKAAATADFSKLVAPPKKNRPQATSRPRASAA